MSEYTGRRRGRPEPEPEPESEGYQQPYDAYYEPHSEPHYEPQPYVPEAYVPEQQYYEPQQPQYYDGQLQYDGYTAHYDSAHAEAEMDYAEPRFEPTGRRRGAPAHEPDGLYDPGEQYDFQGERYEPQGSGEQHDFEGYFREPYVDQNPYDPGYAYEDVADDPAEQPSRRTVLSASPVNALPPIAVATVALAAASVAGAKPVAVVVALLQVAVAWAVLNVLALPSRRAAVVAVLPALGADAGAFTYSADVSATAVAGAVGCGFVLAAADIVLRSARRGVEAGASRDLAVGVVTLLATAATALYVCAARIDQYTVLGGALVGGFTAFVMARRTVPGTRAAAIGLPFALAALASYAAAILVA